MGDVAYASERARSLRARGAGSLKIAADLSARGLDDKVVETAVEESLEGEGEAEWARRALRKARITMPARAWRWLVTHGFPEDVAADVAGGPD